jgi:hypothetical protein
MPRFCRRLSNNRRRTYKPRATQRVKRKMDENSRPTASATVTVPPINQMHVSVIHQHVRLEYLALNMFSVIDELDIKGSQR